MQERSDDLLRLNFDEEVTDYGTTFGTDGARGVANTELTCEQAMAIGARRRWCSSTPSTAARGW
ncbi:MAG: hypothetical protein ACLSS9_05435 [Acutalibacteraceae bacterium]